MLMIPWMLPRQKGSQIFSKSRRQAAGVPQPVIVNGIAQRPIEGVSMVYTWNNANVLDRRYVGSITREEREVLFDNKCIQIDTHVAIGKSRVVSATLHKRKAYFREIRLLPR